MELKVVEKRYVGKPGVTRMIQLLLGAKGSGPYEYTYSDGYVFLPYPRSTMVHDWHYIIQGCSDVTGMKFQPYVDAAGLGMSTRRHTFKPGHYINDREISQATSTAEALARVRAYQGGLNSDPQTWPEPFRSAYQESHA